MNKTLRRALNFLFVSFCRMDSPPSITKSRLNEQRLAQLRYLNVPWITVQTTSYKSSPRFRPGTSPSATPRKHQRKVERKRPYFRNSDLSFTELEIDLLRKADCSDGSYVPLARAPSLLQRLKQKQAVAQKPVVSPVKTKPVEKKQELLRCDSVMSVKELTNEDLEEDIERLQREEEDVGELSYEPIVDDHPMMIDLGEVTVSDIQKSIRSWCEEQSANTDETTVRPFSGELTRKRTAVIRPSRGERKKQRIISESSYTITEMENFNREVNTPGRTKRDRDLRRKVKKTYSGYRYRQFADKENCHVPDYLECIDMTKPQKHWVKEESSSSSTARS